MTTSSNKDKGEEKKEMEKCPCCGEEYEVGTSPRCTCYSGCCDPSYHDGEPCDGSC
jgi:hypothetical protein